MIEATAAAAHFAKVAEQFIGPLDDVLRACYPAVIQSNRDNLTSSVTPDGVAWPPRKQIGDGHPLLEKSGALLQAAVGSGPGHIYRIEHGTDLVVGVDLDVIPYARAQALGYKPRNLPPRQYLGLNVAGEEKAERILGERVELMAFGQESNQFAMV